MELDKELKKAISNLPSAEKDKLIFRLLKKDLVLANRLLFELVSEQSVEERRKLVQENLRKRIIRINHSFYSVGYLNMDVRYLSGEINDHVGTTKDKFGEIELNLFMINEILASNRKNILSASYKSAYKFCIAVIARAFKILMLIKKMHEDYFIEFKERLARFGNLIEENPYLKETAKNNGLDINWLILGNIPEDIAQIHKRLRENGFLS